MASSEVPDSNEPDTDESFDQVCYVLHGAPPPTPRQPGRPPRAANVEPTHANTLPPCLPDEPPLCGLWRQNAFHVVWSRLQSLIRVTLEEQNESNFKDISEWVRDRQFSDTQQQLYRSTSDEFEPESSTYVGLFNRKLDTALLFLGGIDPSDHESIFDGLSTHLKSENCHVARLVASDIPSKCHVGVPLYSLLRQFTKIQPDTSDMEILAAWHSEEGNHSRPLVIIVEHIECCSITALAELIILLSEWSAELPIILVMGVATTVDYLQRFLPSSALGQLVATAFILKSPLERLESVVRAVLVDSFCAFELSHLVAKHLHMHFLRYDLTVSSFVMSLKVACMEHFCCEPLSFVSQWLLRSSSQGELEKQCATLPVELLEYAARLPSAESVEITPENMSKQIASSLWRFKEQKQLWIVALLCAVEVGDHLDIGFLELFVHALCPMQSAKESENVQQPRTRVLNLNWQNLICKLREQTPSVLRSILEEWKRLTSTVNELHAEVCTVYNKFTASVPSSSTQHPDTSKSPLRRPSAENTGSPMECSPEGAQMASPSKNESPRRTSSRLTPAKRLISDASPSSPNRVVVDPSINPYGSPRRPSTRSLASDLDAASGEVPKSPAKTPKSPAKTPKSPAKTPKSLAQTPKSLAQTPKSPAKTPKSPAKTPKSPANTPWKPPPKSPGKTPSRRLLQSPEKYSEAQQSQQPMSRADLRRLASQNSGGVVRNEAHPSNELVIDLFERIILQYLVPTEDLPFHEIICFRNVSSLKQAMTGATRQKVHLDLLGSQLRLQCECCDSDGGLTNSMHDTCLAYQLIQEHNELVNVHDWYYSFVSICCPAAKKGKGKKADKTSVADSVTTQARFTKAATELQIAGLLRMPKKGRPDFAQRVCIN